jgi:F0F1-type ATP synthase assembly protein I
MNVRRLAAIDMYGAQGTTRRRRIILAEFLVVVVVMVAFGIWLTAYACGVPELVQST